MSEEPEDEEDQEPKYPCYAVKEDGTIWDVYEARHTERWTIHSRDGQGQYYCLEIVPIGTHRPDSIVRDVRTGDPTKRSQDGGMYGDKRHQDTVRRMCGTVSDTQQELRSRMNNGGMNNMNEEQQMQAPAPGQMPVINQIPESMMSSARTYIKDKEFEFQLKDLNETRDVIIWKSYDKKDAAVNGPDGQPLKFPLRNGVISDAYGKWYNVKDCLQMKPKDFMEMFPDLRLAVTYKRDVIYNGSDAVATFKMTSNKKLNEAIKMCQNMGNDPLKMIFKQTFDKNSSPADMYSIGIVRPADTQQSPPGPSAPAMMPAGAPPGVTPQATPGVAAVPSMQSAGSIPDQPQIKLETAERDVLDAIIGVHGFNLTEDVFINNCQKNGIEENRARTMFHAAYKK